MSEKIKQTLHKNIESLDEAYSVLQDLDDSIENTTQLDEILREKVRIKLQEIKHKISVWNRLVDNGELPLTKAQYRKFRELKRKMTNLEFDFETAQKFEDEYSRIKLDQRDKEMAKTECKKIARNITNFLTFRYEIRDDNIFIERTEGRNSNKTIRKIGSDIWEIEGTGLGLSLQNVLILANLLTRLEITTDGGKYIDSFRKWYVDDEELHGTYPQTPLRFDEKLLSKMPEELKKIGITMEDLISISEDYFKYRTDREIDEIIGQEKFATLDENEKEIVFTLMNYVEPYYSSVTDTRSDSIRGRDGAYGGHIPDWAAKTARERYDFLKTKKLPAPVIHTLMNYIEGHHGHMRSAVLDQSDYLTPAEDGVLGKTVPQYAIDNATKRYEYLKSQDLPEPVIYALMTQIIPNGTKALSSVLMTEKIQKKHIENALKIYKQLKSAKVPEIVIYSLMNLLAKTQCSNIESAYTKGNVMPEWLIDKAIERYDYLKRKNLPDEIIKTLMTYIVPRCGRGYSSLSSGSTVVPEHITANALKRYKSAYSRTKDEEL